MTKSWLGFFLVYLLISAIPALVLLVRGRGWRPRYLALSFLVAWTGGGWLIMLWLSVLDRPTSFSRSTPLLVPGKNREENKQSLLKTFFR